MRRFVWPCLIVLSLAVGAAGCGRGDSPKAISIKEDTRIQRVGEGGGNSREGNRQQPFQP
jgi:hypothetical protein